YLLSGGWANIIEPDFVIQHDLATWSQPSAQYALPFPSLSGNATQIIEQYFIDEAATCNSGITPKGCGTTYLDGSYQGSQAGTGGYDFVSYSAATSNCVLQAKPTYWGGPLHYMGGHMLVPTSQPFDVKWVPWTS